jgi:hypothetical protein
MYCDDKRCMMVEYLMLILWIVEVDKHLEAKKDTFLNMFNYVNPLTSTDIPLWFHATVPGHYKHFLYKSQRTAWGCSTAIWEWYCDTIWFTKLQKLLSDM